MLRTTYLKGLWHDFPHAVALRLLGLSSASTDVLLLGPASCASIQAGSSCSCVHTDAGKQQSAPIADASIQVQPKNSGSSSSSQQQEPQQFKPLSNQRLQQLRARIFEQHIGDGRRSGRKALLRPLKGRHIANWYFTLTEPKVELLEDELEEE
jgi:hypothetical protein